MTTSITTECSSSEFSVSGEEARDLRVEPAVDTATLSSLRRRAVLEGCKWDPQVGDVDTLTPFPLVLKRSVWKQIASQAEQLTQEAVAAEEEISRRPELLKLLGLPPALCRVLAEEEPMTPAAVRVIRFDFHYTTQGWRISEANSDVPGGFSEASYFTGMMAEHFPGLRPAGNSETFGALHSRQPRVSPVWSRCCPRPATWRIIKSSHF